MSATPEDGRPRVAILGDSWIHGLPFQGLNGYAQLLLRDGDLELLDLSEVSKTAEDLLAGDDLAQLRAFRPDFAIFQHGSAESLVFPAKLATRLLEGIAPQSWKGFEGLQSRAAYSRSSTGRRLKQRVETATKAFAKLLLIWLAGGRRRTPIAAFERDCATLLDVLGELGSDVVVIGMPRVDPWLQPKSNAAFAATDRCLARLAGERHLPFVSPLDHVDRWGDFLADRAHLSSEGHHHLADALRVELANTSPAWKELLGR